MMMMWSIENIYFLHCCGFKKNVESVVYANAILIKDLTYTTIVIDITNIKEGDFIDKSDIRDIKIEYIFR